MSVLPVTIIGDKILDKKAVKVTEIDVETVKLVKNMFETMNKASGIGLAANQVGSSKSIFIIDMSKAEGYEEFKPMVFVNPKIVYYSKEKVEMEEGCLSVPNLRLTVERPERIKIRYNDMDMNLIELEADDFMARVIQHEYDHLQGVLFVKRIGDKERKELKGEIDMIKNREVKVDYKITKKEK